MLMTLWQHNWEMFNFKLVRNFCDYLLHSEIEHEFVYNNKDTLSYCINPPALNSRIIEFYDFVLFSYF